MPGQHRLQCHHGSREGGLSESEILLSAATHGCDLSVTLLLRRYRLSIADLRLLFVPFASFAKMGRYQSCHDARPDRRLPTIIDGSNLEMLCRGRRF